MSSLRLHPKHGVNPTCGVCFWCGKDDGTVALLGAAYRGEAPHRMVLGYEPCAKCKADMALGIALIECTGEPRHENQRSMNGDSHPRAYPTGRWFVMTEEAVRRIFDPEAAEAAVRHRKAFIATEAVEALGLASIPPSQPNGA